MDSGNKRRAAPAKTLLRRRATPYKRDRHYNQPVYGCVREHRSLPKMRTALSASSFARPRPNWSHPDVTPTSDMVLNQQTAASIVFAPKDTAPVARQTPQIDRAPSPVLPRQPRASRHVPRRRGGVAVRRRPNVRDTFQLCSRLICASRAQRYAVEPARATSNSANEPSLLRSVRARRAYSVALQRGGAARNEGGSSVTREGRRVRVSA